MISRSFLAVVLSLSSASNTNFVRHLARPVVTEIKDYFVPSCPFNSETGIEFYDLDGNNHCLDLKNPLSPWCINQLPQLLMLIIRNIFPPKPGNEKKYYEKLGWIDVSKKLETVFPYPSFDQSEKAVRKWMVSLYVFMAEDSRIQNGLTTEIWPHTKDPNLAFFNRLALWVQTNCMKVARMK